MVISEAINRANEFRPNSVPYETKRLWLHAFEADIAETMCVDCPTWNMDSAYTDYTLLAEHPWDYIYPYLIMPQIDLWNQDPQLYQIDSVTANNVLGDFKRHYIRNRGKNVKDNMPTKIKGVLLQ